MAAKSLISMIPRDVSFYDDVSQYDRVKIRGLHPTLDISRNIRPESQVSISFSSAVPKMFQCREKIELTR